MKKFQNLINNRKQRKNNLINQDVQRIFPINKIQDGSAKVMDPHIDFKENLGKVMNPLLFNMYERKSKLAM